MSDEISYEAKMLRYLLAYMHIMLLNNLAAIRYQKPFESLPEDQKNSLKAEVAGGVQGLAGEIDAALARPMGGTPPAVN